MKKLCLVFGGNSCEHDISIITGMQLAHLTKENFDYEKIYISKGNRFYLATKIYDIKYFYNLDKITLKEVEFYNGGLHYKNLFHKKICDVECVINCCHGGIGENGQLASLFEINKIAYTSANPLSAGIAMDKSLTKKVVENLVPTVKGIKVTKHNIQESKDHVNQNFLSKIIVKPNSLGSSIGVKVCNKKNCFNHVHAIFEMNDDALIEEKIENLTEYNQACFISDGKYVLSAIESPRASKTFLSFDDKYKKEEKTKSPLRELPAKIDLELKEKINNYTRLIYEKLDMNGVARIDYLFNRNTKELYFNEINSNPGSMAFYLYEPLGIDYITLVEMLVKNATKPKKYSYFNSTVLEKKLP